LRTFHCHQACPLFAVLHLVYDFWSKSFRFISFQKDRRNYTPDFSIIDKFFGNISSEMQSLTDWLMSQTHTAPYPFFVFPLAASDRGLRRGRGAVCVGEGGGGGPHTLLAFSSVLKV